MIVVDESFVEMRGVSVRCDYRAEIDLASYYVEEIERAHYDSRTSVASCKAQT